MAVQTGIYCRGGREKSDVSYTNKDYDETYVVPIKVATNVGIHFDPMQTAFSRRWWNAFYWFEFVNIFVCMWLEFLSMAQTASGGSFEDAVAIFRMMPCFGYTLLSMVKSFKMISRRPVFENIITEVRGMWPKGTVSNEEHDIIKNALAQLNFIVKGYYWCNNALLISFLSPPFLITLKRYFGYEGSMNLHFLYWLPFDPFQPVYYELVLVLQTWHALVVVWCNICGDVLFCVFLSHITTQLDLLSARIRRLIHVPIDNQLLKDYPLGNYYENNVRGEGIIQHIDDDQTEKEHERKLGEIIARHHALIRLSTDVEHMFSFALFFNFINSSIIICFCGFCCVIVEKWNEIAYKSFLLTALSQTSLLCLYGQKLIDSSVGVAEALYSGGWYKASKKLRISIFIMILRSQKPVHITTYGFSVISLASYTMIIKTAWSYFTLLLNTYN